MKKLKTFFFLSILFISACGVSHSGCGENKDGDEGASTAIDMRLHDIWVVERIDGKAFKSNPKSPRQRRPQIEIYVEEMRVSGNDGCNEIGGKIETLSAEIIQFGPIMGTKMACPDMETPRRFNEALTATRSYKIKNLKLLFMDENGKEVLAFQKVD